MSHAPSQTPDRGYMGDRRRGASMGRASVDKRNPGYLAELRRDIAADESTIGQLLDGSFVPGWGATDRETGEYRFTPNFPTPELLAAHIERRQAAMQANKDELARLEMPVESPRIHLAGIRLDSGGYDQGGAYWGHSGWVWEAWTDDGAFYETGRVYSGIDERREAVERLRAAGIEWPSSAQIDRETAKGEIRESLGEMIRFYR